MFNFRKLSAGTVIALFVTGACAHADEYAIAYYPLLRFGSSFENADDRIYSYSAGVGAMCENYITPLNENWIFVPAAELTAGIMKNDEYNARAINVACVFSGTFAHIPSGISIAAGLGPAYLSKHDFGGKDLGSNFQIKTHLAASWKIPNSIFSVGYLFEHISNAGLASPNPGVNFHYIGIGVSF